jgi:hypothetical protein
LLHILTLLPLPLPLPLLLHICTITNGAQRLPVKS